MPVDPQTIEFKDVAYSFAEVAPGSLWVGIVLPELEGVLPVVGDDAGYTPHITLVFADFGDQAVEETLLAKMVSRIAECVQYQQAPTGQIVGYGRFYGEGDDPVFAIPSIPELESIRANIVSAIEGWDGEIAVQETRGWVPHITLGYIPTGSAMPEIGIPETPVTCNTLSIVYAGREASVDFGSPYPEAYHSGAVVVEASDEGHVRVFTEVTFAEVPDWIPGLPVPAVYQHPTYGTIDFDVAVRDQMIEHFRAKVYQSHIPIDIEHDLGVSGAAGYIDDMRVNENGSVDFHVSEWTDLGKRMIENDRTRYVSPTVLSYWTDYSTDPVNPTVYENVLIGHALTTRPFFKEAALRPLIAASDSWAQAQLKGIGMSETNQKPGEKEGADNTAHSFGEMLADRDNRIINLGERVDAVEAENTRLKNEALERTFSEALKGCTDVPGRIAELKALPAELHEGYIKRAQAERDARRSGANFSETGTDALGEASAKAKLNARAEDIRKSDPKLTKELAFSEACRQDAELYRQYRAESQA